ncbi:ribonuclease 3-like isoform X2 [Anneissia japonica]|uniref:ribonuclease 3-like isoform X1 n=1 Tax=Anneissia japonica TaxID=1529436 RepID=UPI00142565F2|nr:ribonuclease 3-like isoform X1 [Anneissia japonica]XP_033099123.1 ribonuclease 3-like isoform X2 [Anneissia japonica]
MDNRNYHNQNLNKFHNETQRQAVRDNTHHQQYSFHQSNKLSHSRFRQNIPSNEGHESDQIQAFPPIYPTQQNWQEHHTSRLSKSWPDSGDRRTEWQQRDQYTAETDTSHRFNRNDSTWSQSYSQPSQAYNKQQVQPQRFGNDPGMSSSHQEKMFPHRSEYSDCNRSRFQDSGITNESVPGNIRRTDSTREGRRSEKTAAYEDLQMNKFNQQKPNYQQQFSSNRRREGSSSSRSSFDRQSPYRRRSRSRSPRHRSHHPSASGSQRSGRSKLPSGSRSCKSPLQKEHRGSRDENRRSRRDKLSPIPGEIRESTPMNTEGLQDEVSPTRSLSRKDRWDNLEKEAAFFNSSQGSKEKIKDDDGEEKQSTPPWIQCSPKENFYTSEASKQKNQSTMAATSKLIELLDKFQTQIVERGKRLRDKQPPVQLPAPKRHWHVHKDCSDSSSSSSDSSSSDSDSEDYDPLETFKIKEQHPYRLHKNLWYNDAGELNEGPLCSCSPSARKIGIQHNIFPGETPFPLCNPLTNNAGKLHHYRITMSPAKNFLTHQPTVIEYDDREYIFEGFSMFSHFPLDEIPTCTVIRFQIEYTIHFLPEAMPENFTVCGMDLFANFLFDELLELLDFHYKAKEGCQLFHFMPRFARSLPNNGKEILSMHHVMQALIRKGRSFTDVLEEMNWREYDDIDWQSFAEDMKNSILTYPGKKPSSVRVDQIDREEEEIDKARPFPTIVHFGVRPVQLTYAGDHQYQKLFKSILKLQHLISNKPKVTPADRRKLTERSEQLQAIRLSKNMSREVTAELNCDGAYVTGLKSDICQHALMLPVLVDHIRYFACLHNLEKCIGYVFKDKVLLKHAMTHPSYGQGYGMNPDHVRNSLYNCGMRHPDYGDEKGKQEMYNRKKGINILINTMSKMAQDDETPSHIHHYERLEFLGDAVVEFITSTHLYLLFPDIEEGGLATFRQAIVQNQHLSVLAKKLKLDHYLLYAHGPDLCRKSDLRHAMANCFEALMGAMYLESGLEYVNKTFSSVLFDGQQLRNIWNRCPKHPLQIECPDGDRHMLQSYPILQKLNQFEDATGIYFKNIRLLARAFTQRTVGYNNLTRGHNQRMEFLGDSVLQIITSCYLYRHFPDHHEGHLSLLRSSLVNNRTQATVARELGLENYIIDVDTRSKKPGPQPTKTLADLLEAFLGALYVDRGLEFIKVFCEVCFFPRLSEFIRSQDWNDSKSQLQQCCLTLRQENKEPELPTYKVIQQTGPTNSRRYTVAVYFRNKRIGTGTASNVQDAQMAAAKNALENYDFPQLQHQKQLLGKVHMDQQPSKNERRDKTQGRSKERMRDERDRERRDGRSRDRRKDDRRDDDDRYREREGERPFKRRTMDSTW